MGGYERHQIDKRSCHRKFSIEKNSSFTSRNGFKTFSREHLLRNKMREKVTPVRDDSWRKKPQTFSRSSGKSKKTKTET